MSFKTIWAASADHPAEVSGLYAVNSVLWMCECFQFFSLLTHFPVINGSFSFQASTERLASSDVWNKQEKGEVRSEFVKLKGKYSVCVEEIEQLK